MTNHLTILDEATDRIQFIVQKIIRHQPKLKSVWRLKIEDTASTTATLTVFKASDVATFDFEPGEWYELEAAELRDGDPPKLIANRVTTGTRIPHPSGSETTATQTRILHVGDTHHGYHTREEPQQQVHIRDPLGRLVDKAIQLNIHAIIHTGNIEHWQTGNEKLSPQTVAALDRLSDHGIEFYYLLGRYDSNESSWQQALADHPVTTHLSTCRTITDDIALFGVDFHSDSWWDDPALDFEPAGDRPAIACFHREVTDILLDCTTTTAVGDLLSVMPFAPVAVALGTEGKTESEHIKDTPACYAGAVTGTSQTDTPDLVANLFSISSEQTDIEQIHVNANPAAGYTVRLARGTTKPEFRKEVEQLELPRDRVFVHFVGSAASVDIDTVEQGFSAAGAEIVTVAEVDSDAANDLVPGIYEGTPETLDAAIDIPKQSFNRADRTDLRVGITPGPTRQTADSYTNYKRAAERVESRIPDSDILTGADLVEHQSPDPDEVLQSCTCQFRFVSSDWESRTGFDSDRDDDVWACPHNAPEGEAYCIFHRSLKKKEPGEANSAFIEAVSQSQPNSRECEFIGASFHHLTLDNRTLSAHHQTTIDLSHAHIAGVFSLDSTILDHPLTTRFARFEGSVNTGSRSVFTGAVDMKNAVFVESANFDHTTFQDLVIFSKTRFCQDASFKNSSFEDMLYANRLVFEDEADFSKAQFGDNVMFYKTLFRESFIIRRARFHRESAYADAQFHGEVDGFMLRADDRVLFENALFTGEEVNFERARFDGPCSLSDVKLSVDGDVKFDQATISDIFEAEDLEGTATSISCNGASFESVVDWTGAEITLTEEFCFERGSVRGELVFEDGELDGNASFHRSQFESFVSFSERTVTGELRLDDIHFSGSVDLSDATLKGATSWNESHIDGALDCENITFDSDAPLSLTRTVVEGTTTFKDADFEGPVDGDNFTPNGRVIALEADFHEDASFRRAVFASDVDLRSATFHEQADFSNSVFEMRLILTEAVFHSHGIFSNATVQTAQLSGAKSGTIGTLLDFIGADIRNGILGQPENRKIYYELADASLGDVALISEDDESRDPTYFDRYGIYKTRFDGFDFAKHESLLDANDWELHGFVFRDDLTKSDLERTYRNAKSCAAAQGYTKGQAKFFSKVMSHRSSRLNKQGELPERLSHIALGWLSDYGESPTKVISRSLVIVGWFAVLFAVLEFTSTAYSSSFDAAVSLWLGGTNPLMTFTGQGFSYIVLSMEAFTTLVLGGAQAVESPVPRFFATLEGFTGAFMIALFLFTLTRVIDR